MAEETQILLNIQTTEAVSNLQQLATNLDAAKASLAETEKGTAAYQAALAKVKGEQAKYNETLNFTAKGLSATEGSFNAMNARLGQLKQEWKETSDVVRRQELTTEINNQKEAINKLNESIGNYQHRVGDYFDQSGRAFKALGDGMKTTKGGMEGLSNGFRSLATNPFMTTIGILVTAFSNLIAKVKETEEGQASLNKVLEVGRKVLEPVGKVVEWLVAQLGKIADWVGQYSPQIFGFLKNIAAGIVGVGNTIGNFLLAPIKAVIAAAKGVGNIFKDIFSGDWGKIKEDAAAAGEGIGDAFKKGVSFKANYETGKELAGTWLDGLGGEDAKAKAAEVGDSLGQEIEDGIATHLLNAEQLLKDSERRMAAERARNAALRKEVDAQTAQDDADIAAELDAMQQEYADAELGRIKEQTEKEQGRQAVMSAGIAATSSILKSVASALEASTDGSEKEANRIKNLKIAAATIDTMEGALKAYNSMAGIPYVGPILGAIAAATVTAAGVAQIAQIRSTKVSADGSSTGSVSAPSATQVNAPTIMSSVPQYAQLTGASEEERINQSQRVYILASDIEASGRKVAVQTAETSW